MLFILSVSFCKFTSPWLPDSADLTNEESLGMVNEIEEMERDIKVFLVFLILMVVILVLFFLFCKKGEKEKQKIN